MNKQCRIRTWQTLILVAILSGCGSTEKQAGHTHLWIGDRDQNIWSYERVETFMTAEGAETESVGFLSVQLSAGDTATLASGVVISFDGETLLVAGKRIDEPNVVVEPNGSIHRNAFIRVKD